VIVDPNPKPYKNLNIHIQLKSLLEANNVPLIICINSPSNNVNLRPEIFATTPRKRAPNATPI